MKIFHGHMFVILYTRVLIFNEIVACKDDLRGK